MPSKIGGGGPGGAPNMAGFGKIPVPMFDTYIPRNQPPRYIISGVTYDENGATLGGVTVEVLCVSENPNRMVTQTISDANGNYSVDVPYAVGMTFQCTGYLAGAPDVAGITVNTLVGTPT